MQTLAAILTHLRTPLALEEVELPQLRHGQVLVEVLCSGICGSQLGEIDGVKGPDAYLPHLLGHEGCAIVLECGEGVKRVRPGDRVVMHWRKAPGHEAEPAAYFHPKLGSIRAGWVTTFQHHSVVSENRLTPVPHDTPGSVAALMGCAVTTALGVLQREARLEFGQSILILGAGGLGLSMVQGAALAGAWPVVAFDRHANRLELAQRLGATHVVLEDLDELKAVINELSGGEGMDVVIENTGLPRLIETGYQLTHSAGTLVLVGVPAQGATSSLYTLPLHLGKTLVGTMGGQSEPARDIPRYLKLYRCGKLDLTPLITNRYPLEKVNLAIDQLRNGIVQGRALLEMASFKD
jgi:Zn-dependent alcohol dehydrogenase